MKHRPVIVDECVSPRIAKYLREMGEEVIEIRNGRPDTDIRRLGHEIGAYIITKDRGFQDYQRVIQVGRKSPKSVYKMLKEYKECER